MKTNTLALAMMITAPLLVTGCATPDLRSGTGSRSGYINEIYSLEKLRNAPPKCLASLTPTQIEVGTYVEIRIHHGRRHEFLSAFVPSTIKPKLHDKVEISPHDCKDGKVPEVRQVLSGSDTATAPGSHSSGGARVEAPGR